MRNGELQETLTSFWLSNLFLYCEALPSSLAAKHSGCKELCQGFYLSRSVLRETLVGDFKAATFQPILLCPSPRLNPEALCLAPSSLIRNHVNSVCSQSTRATSFCDRQAPPKCWEQLHWEMAMWLQWKAWACICQRVGSSLDSFRGLGSINENL